MANTKSIVKTVITVLLLILSLLLSSFIAFSMDARAAESTEEVNYEGKTFAAEDLFTLSKHITPSGAITFETEIFIPEAYRSKRGILISNYADSGIDSQFAFEIGSSASGSAGKLRVYARKSGSTNYANAVFSKVLASEEYMGTDENPKYLHVAVTVDTTGKTATLYLNGGENNGGYTETKTFSSLVDGI